MYIARRILILLMTTGILISSCAPQEPGQPTPDMNAILTAGVGTFAASIFQTQTAMAPPATLTPTVTPTATATPLSLLSPTASATQFILVAPQVTLVVATPTGPTLTPNPSTLGSGCNNLALISDISITGGSVLAPEEQFEKSWKVANTGTCDWVYRYHLVHISGHDVGGRDPVSLGKIIEPGKWTTLTITLRAPRAPGTYTSTWRFADQSGTVFGSTLGVSIEVKASSYP
jgi:hypothetical protein